MPGGNDILADVYERALRKVETMPNWRDVTEWADQKLDVQLWSVQRTIAQAVQEHPRTAVWSCHDAGKSFLAAVLSCHHIDTHPPRQARLITTAPSGHQVRGVLWVEINGLHEKAAERGVPLPGRVNQTEWWIGSYQAGIGRKPNEYNADQFAGFHARYPLIILDEADGVPEELWEGVEPLLTNRKAKLFCIGNPLDASSKFAQVRKQWEKGDDTYAGIVIPYTVTPNFSGEEVSEYVKDVLLATEWVEVKRRTWGDTEKALADPNYQPLENPFWHGRILAEYPPEDASTIISAGMVQNSTDPDTLPPVPGYDPNTKQYNPVQLGVDIAASDQGDYTVVRERIGNTPLRSWKIRTSDDDELENFIVDCAAQATSALSLLVLDGTGVGFGFTGRIKKRLTKMGYNTRVIAVQFAGRSTVMNEDKKTKKFENVRAELYWEVGRENLRQGNWNLAHMDEYDETVADLTAARLDTEALATKQLIKVESKDVIKKRLKRSPDQGEALLLSFFQPTGSGITTIHGPSGRTLPTGAAAATGGRTRGGGVAGRTSRAQVAVPRRRGGRIVPPSASR